MKVGDCISVIGALESFRDKIQINVHRLRIIRDVSEEMLQYQQCDSVQRCYFDPMQPFRKRLFAQTATDELVKQEAELAKAAADKTETSALEVNLYSLNRVKKNLNNAFISKY